MTDLWIRPDNDPVPRPTYFADSPIDFETWLETAQCLDTELVKGVLVNRMAVPYSHERIFAWFVSILRHFAGKRRLGVVLGSRTAVKISAHDGRLPDILFVRADNTGIIHNDAIYGVPDVVIEIVSPNDRPSDLIPLETDYRMLGVPEIVFMDPQKKRVRLVQKGAGGYNETFLTTGRLELTGIPGFWIEVEWFFAATPPDEFDVTRRLLEEAEAREK